ncbi:MAG: NUDIX domain-containing protein [Bacteroidales bacterium]|nr:NUDIX domain-containing protein [Bacteroidales bacterium]
MKTLDLDKMVVLAQCAENINKSNDELLVVYDDDGISQGTASRYICHKLGLLHKVVYLIIENEKGELLVQTRGDTKKGRLDVPVGGHLNINDNDEIQALIREAKEEIAIEITSKMLSFIFTYKRKNFGTLEKPHEKNYEIRKVFYLKISKDSSLDVFKNFENREEIEMVRRLDWVSIEEVLIAIENNRCADGLKESISHFLNWKLTTLPNNV